MLYDLLGQPGLKGAGFPLRGQTGLLIAFPSGLPHEVRPVTRGERLTVVTWFV